MVERAPSRLLLITGTPGTGKRALGHYLAARDGFAHVDLDSADARARFLAGGGRGLRAEVAAYRKADLDLVVTWSARAGTYLPYLRALRSLGFEWIWFDGDRGAASPAFRAPFGMRPRFIDTFEPDGSFRPLESVVTELLQPRPAPVRLRERLGVHGRRARQTLAAGIAVAATAAAAAGAFLLGGTGGGGAPRAVHAAALQARTAHAQPAHLPRAGVLVTGRSLAGVKLGDSAAEVRRVWGQRFVVCRGCKPTTWFYTYSSDDPLGAGVKFRHGRVIAVFTLGSPRGWRNDRGLHVGELLDPFNDPSTASKWVTCTGYGAKSVRTGDAISSVLTLGESVYGFALTRPSEPVCQ